MSQIFIVTDGGAQNRSVASYGYVIKDAEGNNLAKGKGIAAEGEDATNQYAELISIVKGLEAAINLDHNYDNIILLNDSKIPVGIANGGYTSHDHLERGKLLVRVRKTALEKSGKTVVIEWRKAEKPKSKAFNREAHDLTKLAIDEWTRDNQRQLPWNN